jgi:heat shock protein HslJ/uncharacterized membrane protein
MKKHLLFIAVLAACSPQKEKKIMEPITINKVMGVYTGVTPCADCEGIYTRLEFIDSVTYIKSSTYLGKSNHPFFEMGDWQIQNDSVVALSAHGKTQRYLHEGRNIVLLNQEGKRIQGPLANYYKLSKGEPEKNKHFVSQQAAGVDFMAHGNEPSWSIEIDFEQHLVLRTLDLDSLVTPIIAVVSEGSSTLLSVLLEKDTLRIRLSPIGCINDMSGAYSDYAVEITSQELNGRGCGEFINPLYKLTGRWTLTSIGEEVAKESDFMNGLPELQFSVMEKKVSGSTGCNKLTGGFKSDADGSLTFLPLATTRMFCEGKGESKFLSSLHQVDHYKMEGDKLLLTKGDVIVLSFTASNL